jgi:hypothetical protein
VLNITEMKYDFYDVFSLHVATSSLLGCSHTVDPANGIKSFIEFPEAASLGRLTVKVL